MKGRDLVRSAASVVLVLGGTVATATDAWADEKRDTDSTDAAESATAPPPPSAPPEAPVTAPRPVPETVAGEIIRRPNPAVLQLGISLFVGAYVSSAIAGAISTRDADRFLLVPLAGPWIDIVDRGCKGDACGSSEDVARSFVVASAIVQALSVGLTLTAFLVPEVVETRIVVPRASARIVPLVDATSAGVGAIGVF